MGTRFIVKHPEKHGERFYAFGRWVADMQKAEVMDSLEAREFPKKSGYIRIPIRIEVVG